MKARDKVRIVTTLQQTEPDAASHAARRVGVVHPLGMRGQHRRCGRRVLAHNVGVDGLQQLAETGARGRVTKGEIDRRRALQVAEKEHAAVLLVLDRQF